jgi:hypothetical protein
MLSINTRKKRKRRRNSRKIMILLFSMMMMEKDNLKNNKLSKLTMIVTILLFLMMTMVFDKIIKFHLSRKIKDFLLPKFLKKKINKLTDPRLFQLDRRLHYSSLPQTLLEIIRLLNKDF